MLSKTLVASANTNIYGDGPNVTILTRVTDYGDTLDIGQPANPTTLQQFPAWAAQVSNLWFDHGGTNVLAYTPNQTPPQSSISYLATKGAHLALYGAQGAVINNVWFTRMPNQLLFIGGSLSEVSNCVFNSINDPQYPGLQEGLSQIFFHVDPNVINGYGNPTSIKVTNNNLIGTSTKTGTGPLTLTAADRSIKTPSTFLRVTGPTTNVMIEGLEDGVFSGNYFGNANTTGMSVANVSYVNAKGDTVGAVIDLRISDNMFDGSTQQIAFSPVTKGASTLNVVIDSNTFNGESDSAHAVSVLNNQADGGVSVNNMTLNNNTFNDFYASPVVMTGASGFSITGNTVLRWNVLGVSLSDAQFTSPMTFFNKTVNGTISANTFEGTNRATTNTQIFTGGISTITLATDNNYSGL